MSKQNEFLGKICKDKVTDFVGVATGRIVWMFGCDQYILQEIHGKDAKTYESIKIDESSIEVIDNKIETDPYRDEIGNQEKFFGKLCKDKITGFEGICTGRAVYLFSCDQYCLTPKVGKKGKKKNSSWFDEGRLEVVGKGINIDEVKSDTGRTGGMDCMPDKFIFF